MGGVCVLIRRRKVEGGWGDFFFFFFFVDLGCGGVYVLEILVSFCTPKEVIQSNTDNDKL